MTTARTLAAKEGDALIIKRNLPQFNLLQVCNELYGINRWIIEKLTDQGILSIRGHNPVEGGETQTLMVGLDEDLWTGIVGQTVSQPQ